MKRKIIAFYDVLLYAIICGPLIICAIFIFIFGKLNNLDWILAHWYLVVLFAIGIVIPITGTLLFRYFIIENNETAYFHYFPFTKSWERAACNIDIRWNQNMFISEITNIEIVKLSNEEKKEKVFYKHWFNKYLKVNFYYGNPKYIYVGNYSDFQIRKIIKWLTNIKKRKS